MRRSHRCVWQSGSGDMGLGLVESMSIDLKPAAFLAAAAFGLLIIFSAAWPGPGVWMLALGLTLVAAAAAIWLRGARDVAAYQRANSPAFSPSADAMTYSRSPAGLSRTTRPQPQTSPRGVSIAVLTAAVGVVALVLFIGGVLGSSGSTGQEQVGRSTNVDVIDRTGTDVVGGSGGVGTTTAQGSTSSTTQPAAGEPTASTQGTAPLRPIVVNDPSGAAPLSQRAIPAIQEETPAESVVDNAPRALTDTPDTIAYIVQQGDTLWDIASRYGVTVSVLADLNTLINAEIHPGDELIVPAPEE